VAKIIIQLQRSFRRRVFRNTSCALALIVGCSSGNPDLSSRRNIPSSSDDPADFVGSDDPSQLPAVNPMELPEIAAHAVAGIAPAHGPFRGGQVAVIQGNGFSSQVRVWLGDVEVAPADVTTTRADRIQIVIPPGAPGLASVTTQNGDDESTRASLGNAYRYDDFFAEPERGPSSGGSIITLIGSGTEWDADTTVQVEREPCEVLEVRGDKGGPQELDCRVPPGSEGQKNISVTSADAVQTVIGAFNYESGASLQGGLSGAALTTQLSVHVTAPGGRPIAGAYVILGSDFEWASLDQPGSALHQTDVNGTTVFTDAFAGPALVTIAARCFQPLSFVGVPVDTVRAELLPTASPECASGSPPNFGGSAVPPVLVRGELVWRGAIEFQRASWTNVPAAAQVGERNAAYIFEPSSDPEGRFRLPREDRAITLDTEGFSGYRFEVATGSGNRTFYALAGIENRAANPPRFTAYAMGLLRGVFADPGDIVEDLAIRMDHTLDQGLTLNIDGPLPTPRGPTRVEARLALQVSETGFALLPNTEITTTLPADGSLQLIGLPALVGELENAQYAVSARAVSGVRGGAPLSVLPLQSSSVANLPIVVGGFVPVPTLTIGSDDQVTWNRQLGVEWEAAGRDVALVEYEIRSGAGLVSWSVAAPPGAGTFTLPDLSLLPAGALIPGIVEVAVSLASLPEFDYAELATEDLQRFSWEAYSSDLKSTRHGSAAE
jgi:IPT/TIG domain-containing protein